MITWKYINLFISAAILILGIITVVQFSILVWQRKNDENIRKFKRLAIRFIVLVVLAVVMMFLSWLFRQLYMFGML